MDRRLFLPCAAPGLAGAVAGAAHVSHEAMQRQARGGRLDVATDDGVC